MGKDKKAYLIHNVHGGFGEERERVFKNYSPTIRTPKGGGHLPDVVEQKRIRRLTPRECERLQGFPDDWTKGGDKGVVSDTQRYKQMGNSLSIPVVQAIGRRILGAINEQKKST
jgi:site-specific DNA-cytosine methylase|tara:strand:+ start:651 stop:992 length:342 start_codon:yes stop_codon:yes gene_type:complete